MNPINFVFIYNYVYHKKVDLNSSEKRDLCLMKLSSKTLQILTYFWKKKPQINQGIEKPKVAGNITIEKLWVLIPKIWQSLKCFARYFHQE